MLLLAGGLTPAMAKDKIVFSVLGDTPYSLPEYVLLPQQLAELPRDSAFVVHVGDIKTGAMPCNEQIYEDVSRILAKSPVPLFIIPGDNEWNDCANPADGWKLWTKHFQRFETKFAHKIPVQRQPERDENFAFLQADVLFIGLNLVGGRVHDADEWKVRHAQNAAWTEQSFTSFGGQVTSAVIFGHALPVAVHQDYFDRLSAVAKKFEKPIIYLHGDGHRWIYDRPFESKNILRVQIDQGAIAPPIKVTVTDDPQEPFVIDRRKDLK